MASLSTVTASRSWPVLLSRLATAAAAVVGVAALAAPAPAQQDTVLADGTYLFGESPIADTLGATYFVVQVDNQQVVGALYQPSSSFDCVHGEVTTGEMRLTIASSFGQEPTPYTVALTATDATVAQSQGAGQGTTIAGMQPLTELSALDWQLLERCGVQ